MNYKYFLFILLLFNLNITGQTCDYYAETSRGNADGEFQITGMILLQIKSNCFSSASPESPIYIRIGFEQKTRLSKTKVDPLVPEPLSLPIHLAIGHFETGGAEHQNSAPTDAISIVRWREGEEAIWLKVSRSSDRWIFDPLAQTHVPPTESSYLNVYIGLSPWRSFDFMNQPSSDPNLPFNQRKDTSPVSTLIVADLSQSGLVPFPESNPHPDGFLLYDIETYDDATANVTTALDEADIVFGQPLGVIEPISSSCYRAIEAYGDNLITPESVPDANFLTRLLHHYGNISQDRLMQIEHLDLPINQNNFDLPIRDLTGLELFSHLNTFSSIGGSVEFLPDLHELTTLENLLLPHNKLATLPLLPSNLVNVGFEGNRLNNIENLVDITQLGTESHHHIFLEQNLLGPSQCDLIQALEMRTQLSGATLTYLNQGQNQDAISFSDWPERNISQQILALEYELVCP